MNKETEEKYSDIINMERPIDERILSKYPKMSLQDRAKIFAPFAALRGHSERLSLEDTKMLRMRRVELSEEEASFLSDALSQINKGDSISVIYFYSENPDSVMGYYVTASGTVNEISPEFGYIKIDVPDGLSNDMIPVKPLTVKLSDVVSIESIHPDNGT